MLRWKIALWLLWVLNVSEPGMISTSQAELPWGHRAESCFNYPGFLLSHCHCEAPGATLPCGAVSPCRGGDDNSDNGSTRSTDATQVPSEIWEAESNPVSLWFSLCLAVFALRCSLFFHVRKCSEPAAAWRERICIHTTMKWDLIGCHQLPMWHWDHSRNAAGTCGAENYCASTWLVHVLIRCQISCFPNNRWPLNSRLEMVQLLSFSDSAKSQLVNSLLPAVCSHRHWLHIYLNEAPQWLWKHMSWLVTPCQLISSVVWRITVLWWYWIIVVVCNIVQSLCGNITAATFPIHILNIKSSEWKYSEEQFHSRNINHKYLAVTV